jgi:Tol biopolymer transport system component
VDEKRTGYETSIWTVATPGGESAVRMTNGKHDAQPQWSPDGKRIAFVRGGDKDETGKPKPPQIAMLSLAGGEARILTDLPKGTSRPVWSPDSKRIAFLSSTTLEDIEKARNKDSSKSKETRKAGSRWGFCGPQTTGAGERSRIRRPRHQPCCLSEQ